MEQHNARLKQNTGKVFARIESALKLRHMGLGFVWAWIYCAFETSALNPARDGISINADPSWLPSAISVVVALVVVGLLLARNGSDLSQSRALQSLSVVMAFFGTMLTYLTGGLSGDTAGLISLVSGVLTGGGTALLMLLWADSLARLDIEQVEVIVPGSALVMLVCALVFPYLDASIGGIAVASLPLISGILLVCSYRETGKLPKTFTPHHMARHAFTDIARVSVTLFGAYGALGCMGALSGAEDLFQQAVGLDLATLAGSAVGIVLMVCFVLFSSNVSIASLMRWLMPCLVFSLALYPWKSIGPSVISASLASITDTVLQTMVYLYVIRLASQNIMPVTLGAGLCLGAGQLGVLVGNLGGDACAPLIASGELSIFVVVLSLICLVVFTQMTLPQKRTSFENKLLPVSHVDSDDTAPLQDTRVKQLTEAHGLSARESEILAFLAKGRSQPFIREQLVLSKNTVATHVKHIYQKLDVHSRQELLDLFDND